MLRAGQLRPWAWAQPAYMPVSVSTQSWESCPPAPAWTVMIAPRPSSRLPDCWARSHRSRSRARLHQYTPLLVQSSASLCQGLRLPARFRQGVFVAECQGQFIDLLKLSGPAFELPPLSKDPGFLPGLPEYADRGVWVLPEVRPCLFQAELCEFPLICSGLKPRGCPGCQLPGLRGGRSPAVSFLCVPMHFSSPLRESWAFRLVRCGVEAARVEAFRLRPGTPGPAASWLPPGPGR